MFIARSTSTLPAVLLEAAEGFSNNRQLGLVTPKIKNTLFSGQQNSVSLWQLSSIPKTIVCWLSVVRMPSTKNPMLHKLRTKRGAPQNADCFWLLAKPSDFQSFNTSDPQLEAKWFSNLLFFLIMLEVFLEGKWPISMWGMVYRGNRARLP